MGQIGFLYPVFILLVLNGVGKIGFGPENQALKLPHLLFQAYARMTPIQTELNKNAQGQFLHHFFVANERSGLFLHFMPSKNVSISNRKGRKIKVFEQFRVGQFGVSISKYHISIVTIYR